MFHRDPTARVAVLGLLALASIACATTTTPPPSPPVTAPPVPTAEVLEAARQEFATVVTDYGQTTKAGALSSTQCDDLARRFESIFTRYGPAMSVALFNAGAVREQCEQADVAEALYRRVVAADPGSDLAHNQLGVLALRRHDRAAALPHFRKAIEANSATRAPRNNLAAALRDDYASKPEDEAFRRAEYQVQNVLAVDSGNRAAFENLARLYYDRGRLQDRAYLLLADLVVTQGLAVTANNGESSADLHVIRGLILMERGADVRALRSFDKAIEVDPDHGDAHMNVAMVALRFRDFSGAQKSLAIAAKHPRHDQNIETYLGLGVAYRGLRDYKAAQQAFERAQKLDSKDPRPLYNLGVLLHEHVGPSADGFDEPTALAAKDFFGRFSRQAADDRRYSADVKDAQLRMNVIDESIEINKTIIELQKEADAMAERQRQEEMAERQRMLEIERRAHEAARDAEP